MATVGSLVVDLVANTASFAAGMRNARNEVQSFQQSARNIRFDVGNLEGASDLAKQLADASAQVDALTGGFSRLGEASQAFSGVASSASGVASAIEGINAAIKSMNALAAGASIVGLLVAAVEAVKWIKESGDADFKAGMEATNAEISGRTREKYRYDQFRASVNAEQAMPLWSTQLADKATQERARQDAIAARRAVVTGQIDSILTPLKDANAKAGMSPGDAAAYDMERILLEPLRKGAIDIADFREAVQRARDETNKKVAFDAQKDAEQKKAADDMAASREEAALVARIKEQGLSDVDKFEREKAQIEALQRTDKITAEEASKAIANSSARLLRDVGGKPIAAGALGNGTPGAAALTFGTNQAFTAEVNKSNDVLQQILLEERLQRAANQRAADKLADMQPATVFTFTA